MSYHVLTPAFIGNVRLKNRTLFPSMCHFYCDDNGFVTEQLKAYVKARAAGGVGAIIMPGSPHGKPSAARPALSSEEYYPGWRALRDICHEYDCRLFVQIHPAKAQAGRDPSLMLPDNMPLEMIEEITDSYARCAAAAKEIGLDGVEIHGAHAHEVAQFMSPYYNHRTDGYGGSPEGRAKIAVEVIQKIKAACGADFSVIFRMGSREMIPGGREVEESVVIARLLERAGADALHVSMGMPESEAYISAPMDLPDGVNLDDIGKIKHAVGIPVIGVNRINSPELAETVIASGTADFVAIGRALLADPDFVRKIGTGEPIRRCLACNQGCRKSITKKAIYCVQNPFTGREASLALRPDAALAQKKVLIVGAGVAGLEAAIDLAIRGVKPTIWEKQPSAGGLINLAKTPPFKSVMARMVDYRLAVLAQYGIEIAYNREATLQNIADFAPDIVLLATGSRPSVPPIEGLTTDGILRPPFYSGDDALAMIARQNTAAGLPAELGKKIAVLGGGMVGVELADSLAEADAQVVIFEMGDQVGKELTKSRRYFVQQRLEQGHVCCLTDTKIKSLKFPSVIVERGGQEEVFTGFDSIIVALGRRPNTALKDALEIALPQAKVLLLGDANSPKMAMDAVTQAAELAAAL